MESNDGAGRSSGNASVRDRTDDHEGRTSDPDGTDPVIALLEEWLADESGYDEETWPELKAALNRERELIGARKLFRD